MVKQCSREGCTNNAVKGGVCITHGAKVTRKCCSHEGCTNYAQKGGVCFTHDANTKRCSHEGCTNYPVKGGVCVTHGANTKQCSQEGCRTNVTNDINIKGDKVVTNKGCEGVNNDVMHLNIIHITSTEGGREVNLRILSL
jgi:hypothetical protein